MSRPENVTSSPGSSSSFIRGKWSQWVSQPVPGQAVLVPEDRDEPPARLDQPPGRQRGLAEEGHAVELAGLARPQDRGRRPA